METQPTVVVFENEEDDVIDSAASALAMSRVGVHRFSCARATLDFCKPDMLGCFVIDHQVREIGGLHLRRKLVAQGCQQPFIFITRHGDVGSAVEAMHQGALDCIPKPLDPQRLIDGVQQAIALDAATRGLRAERAMVTALTQSLTPREKQILDLVAAGNMTKQIARDLTISPKTVEVHRSNIMRKMRVGSAAALLHLVAMHAVAPLSVAPAVRAEHD